MFLIFYSQSVSYSQAICVPEVIVFLRCLVFVICEVFLRCLAIEHSVIECLEFCYIWRSFWGHLQIYLQLHLLLSCMFVNVVYLPTLLCLECLTMLYPSLYDCF